MTKAKAIWMPGKERPATSQSRIQGLRPRSLTIGMLVKNTKPSAIWLVSQTAEGLDRRFLRSQPRVLGPGSLRKARPRRSDYQFNTKAKTTCPDVYPSRGYNVRQGSNGWETTSLLQEIECESPMTSSGLKVRSEQSQNRPTPLPPFPEHGTGNSPGRRRAHSEQILFTGSGSTNLNSMRTAMAHIAADRSGKAH